MVIEGEYLDGDSLEHPEFHKAGKVHDWRNYVSDRVQALWPTFTHEQRVAIALQAAENASCEHWE